MADSPNKITKKIINDSDPVLTEFRNFLQKKGSRYTKERENIIKEILSCPDHFDVDELFIRLHQTSAVSKASIYRTLPLLIECGILTEVYLEDGHMHYEHVHGKELHSHLICQACRQLFEFSDPLLRELEHSIAQKFDFKNYGHKFEIWGLCSKCRQKMESSQPPKTDP